jgi:hypothetical protein
MGLLEQYFEARAAVEAAVALDWECQCFDRALALEVEAESALLQFVKIANRQDPARPVEQPLAAVVDGVLVVVARNPEASWEELIHVVEPRNIAGGE